MQFGTPTTTNLHGDGAPAARYRQLISCGAAVVMLALAASGCTTTGQPTAASATRGPTVAFESIDGPPESVFHRLVQQISDEAEARQVAVVPRADTAQYRVKSYVATHTQGKRSTVSWVWDVYDSEQRRTLRITGEEPASFAGTGTWAAADDQVLRRMARNGMDRLVAFLAAPADPAPAAPVPAPSAKPQERIADAAPVARPGGAARTDGLAYLDAGR